MYKANNIIHVELREPFNGKKNYYFGSVSAMFQELPESIIGVKPFTVRRHLMKSLEYRTPGATIRKGILLRKSQSRTSKEAATELGHIHHALLLGNNVDDVVRCKDEEVQ